MYFNSKIQKLYIDFDTDTYELFVCTSKIEDFQYQSDNIDFLNDNEKEVYFNLPYKRKRKNFLLGRYAAKRAVHSAYNLESLQEIEIQNGILDQPLIRYEKNENSLISISHCDNIGTAIVFPDALSVGIDIEKINPRNLKLLNQMLTNNEIEIVGEEQASDIKVITMMWSVKEALSKCIKTGFTLPIEFFEIKNFNQDGSFFYGEFKNFIQYKYLSQVIEEYMISIVYPSKSKLYIQDKLI